MKEQTNLRKARPIRSVTVATCPITASSFSVIFSAAAFVAFAASSISSAPLFSAAGGTS